MQTDLLPAILSPLLTTAAVLGAAAASALGPTPQRKDLQALLVRHPELEEALVASLRAADVDGRATLQDFYALIDRDMRHIPTHNTLLEQAQEFFYLIGHSEDLKASPEFRDWVNRFVHAYGTFLDTPASVAGIQTFLEDPRYKADDFCTGPSGWHTFNQFFARSAKPGKRPISGIGDVETVVTPVDGVLQDQIRIETGANITVKGRTYAIDELCAGSDHADTFAGGTLIHLHQRITDYHRLHTPFAGTVVEKKNIADPIWLIVERHPDGSYSSVDGAGFQWRQERGLIVFKTKEIGLVAVIPVGMGLVDDVVLTPDLGAQLHKGEEIGYFQVGGSDTIVLFEKNRVEITAEVGQLYLQGAAIGRSGRRA